VEVEEPTAERDAKIRDGRTPLIIGDEVGSIPFEAEAANLFFQLVSSRYQRPA
jgi:DNA replication protein DnaC